MHFDTELRDATVVTFAGGSLSEQATLGFVAVEDGHCIVVTDMTPFHPISLSWPDQPGDRGWLTTADGLRAAVLDSREAVLNVATGTLFTEQDGRDQRRVDPDLRSVVLHLLAGDAGLALQIGQAVRLEVDHTYRAALSLQHTGVHLASLALNQCAAAFWTKDYADLDCTGYPNFDKAAVSQSAIAPDGSTDLYRIGKSLRKKGFDRDAFLSDLPARCQEINDRLRSMIGKAAAVTVTPGAGHLDERRLWSTTADGGELSIFCGGTHIFDLSQIGEIVVNMAPVEEGFSMVTKACST